MKLFVVVVMWSLHFISVQGQTYNCKRLDDCQNGAPCDSATGTCTCTLPLNSYNCQYDTTVACADTTVVCENGGSCIDDGAGASICACPYGFFGDTCQNSIANIDCTSVVTYTLTFPSSFTGNVGLDVPSADAACQFLEATDASGMKTYTATFDLDPAATTNCPLTNLVTASDPATSTDTYSGLIRVNYLTDITTSLDELYTLTCMHVAGDVRVYQEVQEVTLTSETDLSPVSKDKQYSPVELTLQTTAGAAMDTAVPVVVGDDFNVVVYLTDATAYTHVRIENCEANDTTNVAPKTYPFFEQGCPTSQGKRIVTEQTAGQSTVNSVAYPSAFITLSAFKFVETSKIGLMCLAKICKTEADCAIPTDCDAVRAALDATPAPTVRRKRRDAGNDVTDQEETVSTEITVLNPGEALPQAEQNVDQKVNVENCLLERGILSMMVVLGAVVCILLIATFLLGCVIIRRRSPKPTFEPMGGRGNSDRFHIPRARVNESFARDI